MGVRSGLFVGEGLLVVFRVGFGGGQGQAVFGEGFFEGGGDVGVGAHAVEGGCLLQDVAAA